MNVAQAKTISIASWLASQGFQPVREAKGDLWYKSPLRPEEATASFKVNTARNLWYDFGTGQGGDIIKLVQVMHGVSTVSDALAILGGSPSPAPVVASKAEAREPEPDQALELLDLGPVTSKTLLRYLEDRGIDPERAKPFLHELHYRRGEKTYYAIGFANRAGGFELRNPYFKGSFRAKDITQLDGNPERVLVFEGFFDFLTLATRGERPDATVIVLNSAAMRDRALQAVRQLHSKTVETYFDHDQAGRNLQSYFVEQLPDHQVIDQSGLYAGCKDFNEWHIQQLAIDQRQPQSLAERIDQTIANRKARTVSATRVGEIGPEKAR